MSDKPSSSILPVFPEGDGPRRRSPWWKRMFRPLAAGWNRSLGALLDFVLLPFGFLWKYLEIYVRGRQLRRLLYGLPALAVLVGAGVMAALLVQAGHYDVRPSYRTRAQQARARRDLDLARVCYLRLMLDDKPQPADMFGLYQTLRDLKQEEQADALLRQLTVWEGVGYAPAHVARARNLVSAVQPTAQDVSEAQRHLRKALDLQPDMIEAHARLGEIYFRLQDWKNAEKHLEKAEPADPMLARLLMHAAIAQGKTDRGDYWATHTIEACRKRLQADPNDTDPNSVVTRLVLVEAFMNLKDYEAATKELEYGKKLDPQRPEYPQALAQVCATQVQALPKDKTIADTAKRWQLVELGLQNDPNNLILLQQLLAVTHGTDAAAEQARNRLQELLARGQSSAVLHMALGLDAYAQGKPEPARIHWERAFDLDPNRMLVAANNVAWLLSHPQSEDQNTSAVKLACGIQASLLPVSAEPANLDRALKLMEFVLKQDSKNPRYRETRGQILARMGRWKESVSDLEYALPGPIPANKGPIHATLAKAYQELGLPDLAEQHRKLAQAGRP